MIITKNLTFFHDNNSDFDKKAVEMEIFSDASSLPHECDVVVVKLELFGNILLVFDTNTFGRCRKAIYRVKSSSAKRNLSIVEEKSYFL